MEMRIAKTVLGFVSKASYGIAAQHCFDWLCLLVDVQRRSAAPSGGLDR